MNRLETVCHYQKNGRDWQILAHSESTRTGFRHIAVLLQSGFEIARNVCYYYNRTWEEYRFQSVARGAVHCAIAEREGEILQRYRTKNNLQRMTAKRREEVEKIYKADRLLIDLNEFLQTI